ncbi:hypothetical protein [Streptomyces sp. NPDC048650]|uniref:hypothetical protein n=1 Tax=unclassified Streptomyces TaxID=2593676 RepID=UPI00371E7D13
MPKKHRTPSTTPHQDYVRPGPVSRRRLVSVALLTGAVRHTSALLAGLAVTERQYD